MPIGQLVIVGKKQTLQVRFTNKNGKTVCMPIKEAELSHPLLLQKKRAPAELHETEVELEEFGGRPVQIREKGKSWESPSDGSGDEPTDRSSSSARTSASTAADGQATEDSHLGKFHNPYNFIPAPPRNTSHPELADRKPVGHGSYHSELWSGRIAVQLTAVTPLLIPDASREREGDNQHKTQPIRESADGAPILPPTSIKGMLRAAYEAVTNSRLGVWQGHEERLAYRMPARASLEVEPARVERRNGKLYLIVMKGGTAKLPRYCKKAPKKARDKGESQVATRYEENGQLPQHGDRVWFQSSKGKVEHIKKFGNGNSPPEPEWQKGWVCVTGPNIQGKCYERVFIEDEQNEHPIKVDSESDIESLWEELIRNYQETHQKELEERKQDGERPWDYLDDTPGRTGWSRHVWCPEELKLDEGTLCYVDRDKTGKVQSIQPVTISRRLYACSPKDLLDESLKPASSSDELSPADRTFGWVKPNGHGSYKGNVRVSHCVCQSDDAIERFEDPGLPLQILGPPKPQQTRFYTAQEKDGRPLEEGVSKGHGYESTDRGLRGRKVYPHHRGLPNDHWKEPQQASTQYLNNGHCYYREYRRPPKDGGEQRDSQNRSIKGWVKPGVTFSFNVDVTNLSPVELGALLWLLDLPQGYYHRLGGGKPLGFGSVQIAIDWDKSDLRTGSDWEAFYRTLQPQESPDPRTAAQCMQAFKDAIQNTYQKQSPEEVGFIAAFMRAAKGFEDGLPVHYPRCESAPNPDGETFKWFEANERKDRNRRPRRFSLPAPEQDNGLPLFE